MTATRASNTVTINVAAGGKTASFKATIVLPTPASSAAPVPVIIAIGGIDNNAYLKNGIAVVTFDYTTVSPDSNGKTGAFWALYNGKDIGTSAPSLVQIPLTAQVSSWLGLGVSIGFSILSYSRPPKSTAPKSA